MVRLSSLLRYGQKTVSLISQHFHLSGRWWTKKNPHHCSKRVGDVDPSGVANLSWAWWVNCEDTLKLEPHSVVCSAPYGGSDYEIITNMYLLTELEGRTGFQIFGSRSVHSDQKPNVFLSSPT